MFLMAPFFAMGQDIDTINTAKACWELSAQWMNYRSFSQQKLDIPMKGGYPLLQSRTLVLEAGYTLVKGKIQHAFRINAGFPASLQADAGTGSNRLLEERRNTHFRSGMNHQLTFPLFQWKGLNGRHGLSSGLLYERRRLVYLSGSQETTRDINFYLGPSLKLRYALSSSWKIKAGFDAHFYLPYLNYGQLTARNSRDEIAFSSDYRGFYYQTIFRLGVSSGILTPNPIELGVLKNDMVGFASRKPSFEATDIVHFKLDRLLHFYLKYRF
jgi:hypothetical protein